MIDIKKNGGFYYIKEKQGTSLISEETYLAIHAQNQQLQQYKSIVKAVDPDNLPKHRVITLGHGYVYIGKYESQYVFVSENGNRINNQHYIETKDIIKMMGGL